MVLALQKSVFSIAVGGVPANIIFLTLATTIEMKVFGKEPASGADRHHSLARRHHSFATLVSDPSFDSWKAS